MKVLLINGSPHKEGCTFTALSEIARTLNENGVETVIFHIGNRPVGGCTACGGCKKLGKCVFEDSVNEALPKVAEADGIVFGSPVHYAAAAGSMSGFMHRLSMLAGKDLQYKPAAVIASARRAGTTATLDELAKVAQFNNMPLISSCYWNMVHGSKAEDVAKDEEGLQIMRNLGQNMAWILKSIEAGKAAGVPQPKGETRVYTNFIR